jgi:hypothetical protein
MFGNVCSEVENPKNAHLDLLIEAADVRVRLLRRLLELHDRDHGVRVVREDAHDGVNAVVEENGAT